MSQQKWPCTRLIACITSTCSFCQPIAWRSGPRIQIFVLRSSGILMIANFFVWKIRCQDGSYFKTFVKFKKSPSGFDWSMSSISCCVFMPFVLMCDIGIKFDMIYDMKLTFTYSLCSDHDILLRPTRKCPQLALISIGLSIRTAHRLEGWVTVWWTCTRRFTIYKQTVCIERTACLLTRLVWSFTNITCRMIKQLGVNLPSNFHDFLKLSMYYKPLIFQCPASTFKHDKCMITFLQFNTIKLLKNLDFVYEAFHLGAGCPAWKK